MYSKDELSILSKEDLTVHEKLKLLPKRTLFGIRQKITRMCFKSSQKKSLKWRENFKGAGNPRWTGDDASYIAIHLWLYRNYKKPDECGDCGSKDNLDWANISGEYRRDRSDFKCLCRKCHMKSDGRLEKLIKNHKKWRSKCICASIAIRSSQRTKKASWNG